MAPRVWMLCYQRHGRGRAPLPGRGVGPSLAAGGAGAHLSLQQGDGLVGRVGDEVDAAEFLDH